MACTTSVGKWCSRSQRAACGAISASANSRTLLRKVSCSALSSNGVIVVLQGITLT